MANVEFIADTSAVIRRLRNDPAVEATFAGKRFAITFVTLAELSHGVLKSQLPEAAWQRMLAVLEGAEFYSASNLTSLHYARIYRELEQRGEVIPVNDIWIAAVCMEKELPLLARDEHFHRVPGLTVVDC